MGEAHAVSCAENEIWSYELVEISGPDTDTDDVWGPGVNLETPDGERLIVWDRDENGFGGSTVFTGELER